MSAYALTNDYAAKAAHFVRRDSAWFKRFQDVLSSDNAAERSSLARQWRDRVILWSKDLSRTMDYLEARTDIDGDRIAYYGFSGGAQYGPIFTAIDPRFKASVLVAGGIPWMKVLPEMAVINFAPRCRVPTLMINGRDDFMFPAESSQRVLFELLGAPDALKRHVLLDSGHFPPRPEMIKEMLNWLDQRLGPVRIR